MSQWLSIINPQASFEADAKGRAKVKRKGKIEVGCYGCPLDKTKGVKKLFGFNRIKQRSAMLWASWPEKVDNQKGQTWKGRNATWFAEQLQPFGLSLKDFDVQNVVRCRPVKWRDGLMYDREATPIEIAHCSGHNDEALDLNKGKAKVHIFLGSLAAKTVLGNEYKKDAPVYWSEKLNARVFVLENPSYFFWSEAPSWRYEEFTQKLSAAAWSIKNPGKFAWLDSLPVRSIYSASQAKIFLEGLRASKVRAAVDIEDAEIDGKKKVLCIGFSTKRDEATVIVLDHPDNPTPEPEKRKIVSYLKGYFEDANVRKCFHYGSYDSLKMQELLGFEVVNYDYDTTYAHFLKYTFIRSHGLETIAMLRYPHYAGYKNAVAHYFSMPGGLANCPLPLLIQYNGADAALTKNCEIDTRKDVNPALLKVYIGAGRMLYQMERRGPHLDREHFALAKAIIPRKAKELAAKIQMTANDPELNPNAPQEIARVMYEKLKLPTLAEISEDFDQDKDDPYNTREGTLSIIHQHTGHPFPKDVLDYRRFAKMESTYLATYERSADMNGGELRTKWYLTGAVTGRLRSGGSKDGFKGVINMQNLHGSPFLKNLLVSDPQWRLILGGYKESLSDLQVFIAFDYSQIEIRMLAECAQDKLLLEQFASGMDIHCAVGNTLNPEWSLEFIKKDKETRTFIKNCHFGLIYGLSEEGLYYYLVAKGVDTTPEKAAKFHRDYFQKYKGVAAFIDRMRSHAEEFGYVETIFGFRRRIGKEFDEDRTTNPANQAVNSPIQGAAHTLLLGAMDCIDRYPKKLKYLQDCVMEVHDALVFRASLANLAKAYSQAKHLLEVQVVDHFEKLFGFRVKVPLISEASIGFRYGVMVEGYQGEPNAEIVKKWLIENEATDKKMALEFGSV